MDLLKFLKKKQADSFEALLQNAADDPKYRAEFMRRILTEKLVVITKSDSNYEGFSKLESNTPIAIYNFPDGRVPIFTSPERIRDKGIFKEKSRFFEAKGGDILDLLKGAKLILNPYSDYCKEFNPEEIGHLLDGTYFKSKQIEIKKDTQVRIGQPAKYPTEAVKSLVKLFSDRPDVVAAYLGWIHFPETADPPHYIFAIETNGDWRTISDEAGAIAQEIIGPDEIIDFVKIDRKKADDYFINKTKPFYTKRK